MPANLDHQLKPFGRRVRFARAWRGAFLGLAVGGVIGVLLELLEYREVLFTSYALLAGCIGFTTLIGALIGLTAKISGAALSKSIDRRANLADRLSSASGLHEGAFGTDLEADAYESLAVLKPSKVFPLRLARAQVGAMFCAALPFVILLIASNHLLLNAQDRQDREAMKKGAKQIEHVLTPFQKPEDQKELGTEEKALQREMEKLQKELEHAKLDKAAAQEKADKISQQAEQLMRQRLQQSLDNVDSAKDAMDRYKDSQMKSIDPSLKNLDGQQLSDRLSELEKMAETAPQKVSDLEKQIAETQKQLSKQGLSSKEKADLQKKLEEMRKQMAELKLSQKVKDMLEKMRNTAAFKEMQELMKELQKNAKGTMGSKRASLTSEQLKELRRKLEELAAQLKTDKDIEEYMKKMLEALKNAKLGNQACAGIGLNGLCNMLGLQGGAYAATDDQNPSGAPLNMNSKESAGQGKTNVIGVRGDRREDALEPSMYMEERGPAKLTGPSSLPLLKNVPASKRKAEEAIDKQQIPKQHQERVKKYFESLEGKG